MINNYNVYDLETLIKQLEIEIKNKPDVYTEEISEAFKNSKLIAIDNYKDIITQKLNLLQLQIITKHEGTVTEKYINDDIISLCIKYFLMFGINSEKLLKLDDSLLYPVFNAMRGMGYYQYPQCTKALLHKELLDNILKHKKDPNSYNKNADRIIFNDLTDQIKAIKPTFEKEEDFLRFMEQFSNNYVYPIIGRNINSNDLNYFDKNIQDIIDYNQKNVFNAQKVNLSVYEKMSDKISSLINLKDNSEENLKKIIEYHKFILKETDHRFNITIWELTLMTIIRYQNISNEKVEDLNKLVQKLANFKYDLIESTLNNQNIQKGK